MEATRRYDPDEELVSEEDKDLPSSPENDEGAVPKTEMDAGEESSGEECDEEDPWEKVTEWSAKEALRRTHYATRPTSTHTIIKGVMENTPWAPGLYFIMSTVSSRSDTLLIPICPFSGTLQFRGIRGLDVFRSEADARARLAAMGLRTNNAAKGPALLGMFTVGNSAHVGVVTKAEVRMALPGHEPVYTVVELQWIPIRLLYPCPSASAKNRYASLITDFAVNNLHYFTDPASSTDLTRPYPSDKTPDHDFVWNTYLAKPFVEIGLPYLPVTLLQGVAVSAKVPLAPPPPARPPPPSIETVARLRRFYRLYNPTKLSEVAQVLRKYAGNYDFLFQKLQDKYGPEPEVLDDLPEDLEPIDLWEDEKPPVVANVALVTRRMKRHAGTRYNARGIDGHGFPGNELECEIIVHTDTKWATCTWRRGSVPLRWGSALGSSVKMGQATFIIKDDPFRGSDKYWDMLARRFAGWGRDKKAPPVTCLSLLHTEPEHGELTLVEAFQQSLRHVKTVRPTAAVDLLGFDWHRTVKQLGLPIAVEGTWALLASAMREAKSSEGSIEVCGPSSSIPSIAKTSPATPTAAAKSEGAAGSGALQVIRGLVSQKKVRYTEGGFNLDLTYITPKLIAMGFPSSGAEGYYRNPIEEVERFLNEKHKGHFRVYNLCTEREYDSDTRFGGAYRRWPFDDHNAPAPISMIPDLVADAMEFLNQHPKNVVAAHCKAGKGRTGVMLCALLMAGAAPEAVPLPAPAPVALGFFGAARTRDGLGVTIPSQRRYLHYYETMIAKWGGQCPPAKPLAISKVVIQSPIKVSGSPNVYLQIHEGPKWVKTRMGEQSMVRDAFVCKYDSRTSHGDKVQTAGSRFTVFNLADSRGKCPVVRGDTKISFWNQRALRGDEAMFHLWVHTSFVQATQGDPLRFPKAELDKACKDEKHSTFRRDLQVEIYFTEVPDASQDLSPSLLSPSSAPAATPPPDPDDDDEEDVGAYVKATVTRRQEGMLRLNCVDSLDRTNLGSFFVALQMMGELRRVITGSDETPYPLLGLDLTAVTASLGDQLVSHLAEAFVNNGDVCSLLYTNTPATHTDAIRDFSPRLGKAMSNAMVSVMRRYQNTMNDNVRDKGFHAFLGTCPRPSAPPPSLNLDVVALDMVVPTGHSPDNATALLRCPFGLWILPTSATAITFSRPSCVAPSRIAMCFRVDPSGDDEAFPSSFAVTAYNASPESFTTIPRTADGTWLYYDLPSPLPEFFTVHFKSISSTLALGGLALLSPPGASPSSPTPPLRLITGDKSGSAMFALPTTSEVRELVVEGSGSATILAGLSAGTLRPLSEGCVSLPATLSSSSPAHIIAIECQKGAVVREVRAVTQPVVFPILKTPPLPPPSPHSKPHLSRKKARIMSSAQDEAMMKAMFILLSESPSATRVAGVRLQAVDPGVQPGKLRIGVADCQSVLTVPSTAARQAMVRMAEDVTVPHVPEGCIMDFHLKTPVHGNLVRIDSLDPERTRVVCLAVLLD